MMRSSLNSGPSYNDITSAIVFGHDDNAAMERIMTNRKGAYSEFSRIYRWLYYFPVSRDGIFQAWMLTQPEWRSRLLHGLIVEKFLTEENYFITHDAYIPEKNLYVLCWLDANLTSLRILVEETEKESNNKYALICLPWQEEIVKRYLGNKVTIMKVTTKHIRNIFEKGSPQ